MRAEQLYVAGAEPDPDALPCTDYFGTPPWAVDLCARVAGPIEHDPFPDPQFQTWKPAITPARWVDGFDPWPDMSTLANPPFSGGQLAKAAATFSEAVIAYPMQPRFFVTIACPGALYWRQHLHVHGTAIAWLGRVAFIALRPMVLGKKSPRTVEAGEEVKGNRHEIAIVLGGGDRSHRDRFRRVFELAGHPVSGSL